MASLALALVALLAVGPASAAESCGKKVIDDWYADGRVDGTYEPHCYDDAIEILPRDIKEYSSAPGDIQRALQNRLNRKPAPPARKDPTPEIPVSSDDNDGDGVPNPKDKTPGKRPKRTPVPEPEQQPPTRVATPPVATASSDSVPVPLLVLGGLALLLVAAGSAGYLTRRLQARRGPQPGA